MADTNVLRDTVAAYTAHDVIAANFTDAVPRSDSEAANYAIASVPDEIINGALVELNRAANGQTYWTDTGILARFGGAPSTGFNTEADELVYGDGTTHAGQSAYIGSSGRYWLAVRVNGGSAIDGYQQYAAASNTWTWGTDGASRTFLSTVQFSPTTPNAIALGGISNPWGNMFGQALYLGDAPTSGWNPSYDDGCLGNGTGSVGLSLYSAAANVGGVAFGDPDDRDRAIFLYSHNVDRYIWIQGGTTIMEHTGSVLRAPNGASLGDASNPWGPAHVGGTINHYKGGVDASTVVSMEVDGVRSWGITHASNEQLQFNRHNTTSGVFEDTTLLLNRAGDILVSERVIAGGAGIFAGAPTSGWNSGADDLVIGDGTDDAGITVYPDAAGLGQFVVRTPAGNYVGAWRYDVSDQRWECAVENSTQFYIGDGYISPDAAGTSTLGTDALPFGAGFLRDDGDVLTLDRVSNTAHYIEWKDAGTLRYTMGVGASGSNDPFYMNAYDDGGSYIARFLEFRSNGEFSLGYGACQMGFFGTSPVSKPTVTGARDDGTALASLLTALANLGLITDNTTAS